jgi:hypothetical protein
MAAEVGDDTDERLETEHVEHLVAGRHLAVGVAGIADGAERAVGFRHEESASICLVGKTNGLAAANILGDSNTN